MTQVALASLRYYIEVMFLMALIVLVAWTLSDLLVAALEHIRKHWPW
jgi:hypothetical protein